MRRSRRGVVLLEVIVALAITGLAGAAAVRLVAASLRDEAAMRERELRLRHAEQLLFAYTMANRDQLDQRIGERTTRGFIVEVQRPVRELYRISVREPRPADAELLATVVYRDTLAP